MNHPDSPESISALKLGPAFKQARERKALSLAAAAAELKMPTHVIEHLEAGRFSEIGAPVFVRGYVRSYGRFLGLPDARFESELDDLPIAAPQLASRRQHSKMRVFTDRYAMRAAYVVLTAAIVLPAMYVATHYAPLDPLRSVTHSLDAGEVALPRVPMNSDQTVASVLIATGPEAAVAVGPVLPEDDAAQPVMASMAPFYRPAADAGPVEQPSMVVAAPGLSLHFQADSWVEIIDRNGERLVYGMVRRGETLNYSHGDILRVALGNASGVQVSRDGEQVDLAAFRRANVARFAVSSAGELEPVGG